MIVQPQQDATVAIQAAVDALAGIGGVVEFLPGFYGVSGRINLQPGVSLKGYEGLSALTVLSLASFPVLNATALDLEDVTIDGLLFDGEVTFPASSQIYKQTYAYATNGIRIAGVACKRVTLKNLRFRKMSGGSIEVRSDNCSGLVVADNRLYEGSYRSHAISVRSVSGPRPEDIRITGNLIDTCGPQFHYDPSKEDWCASAAGIAVDRCRNAIIANNIINRTAESAIRIEETEFFSVSGNVVEDAGREAITCYNGSAHGSIVGNTIRRWGRIPPAYAIRSFGGQLLYAKEFPDPMAAALPADPSASEWFGVWPFNMTSVNASNIIPYSASDYYTGAHQGILPYRGTGAISVAHGSRYVAVLGNTCWGGLSGDSAYGYTNVHSVNANVMADSGDGCRVVGNSFVQCRVAGIYAPEYQDPINQNGLLGVGEYGLN